MNTFVVDGIEFKIVRNPHTNGPMIARVDGGQIDNRKEVCRQFLRMHGWTEDMFVGRITNDLERQINKIINDGQTPREIGNPGTGKKPAVVERLHPEMTQKDEIILHLTEKGTMTHRELSIAMYGDGIHLSNINESLQALVREGVVIRTGERPAYYSLSGKEVVIPEKPQKPAKSTKQKTEKDSSLLEITNENLDKVHNLVLQDPKYGRENDVITASLKAYPKNDNVALVAMKIALIDITNSTHISQHKQKVSIADLAEIIVGIKDVDERIAKGDPEVVNEIARTNGEINLFSFASKYCCYHNHNLYERDDYAILDTVLMNTLPQYFDDIRKSDIENWRRNIDYKSYNDYITRKLDELGITTKDRRRKFDHFVWYLNR